jgi:hypothetical protein
VRLEELGQLKNSMTSPGVEPATFLLETTNYAAVCPKEGELRIK